MADYKCTYRTNYFQVTDEEQYEKLFSKLHGDDLESFDDSEHPDLHGFGGFGDLEYRDILTVKEWMSRPEHEKPAVFFEATYVNEEWLWVPIPDPDPETIGKLYVCEVIEKEDEYEIRTCDEKSYVIISDNRMFGFYQALQKILPDREAMILMEVGNEKLRYVVGLVTIVTNKEIRFVDMNDVALKTVKSMIGEDFTTQLDY